MSFKRHLTAGIALTVGLVTLTGSALAAPPSTPPGQEKKAEQAPAPAATASETPSASAEQNKGQEQKAAKAESSTGINATTAGVKPSNNTDKNTSCKTGGSGSSTTCTRSPHGTNPPDSSKRYGNGTTAAQIATSRGAAAGTEIRGPGNSQPHKVCKKVNANGKEVWVDVHAVKSYSATQCAPSTTQQSQQSQGAVTTSCPAATTTTSVVGVLHKDKLMTNQKSAHFTKHGDEKVSVSSTTMAAGTCGTASTGTSGNSSTNVTSSTSQTSSTTSGASAAGSLAGGTLAAGGVAGVATESGSPQSGSNGGEGGGVLGAFGVAGVAAGGVLPFTGFPLWLAILIAIGLIAIGWTLYRRGRPTGDLA